MTSAGPSPLPAARVGSILQTWWSAVAFEREKVRGEGNGGVIGNIKPASFLEFAIHTELFAFVEAELKNMPANSEAVHNPKLLFYTLMRNAFSLWELFPFSYHPPGSWLNFARFLLRKRFSPNAMLEMNAALSRLELTNACQGNRPNFWTPDENNRGIELKQHGHVHCDATDEMENIGIDSEGYETDKQAADAHRVSILHLALAIACTRSREGMQFQTVYRLDMFRVLVEESGNDGTSNYTYRNYWHGYQDSVVVERSAVHYLLSCQFDTGSLSGDHSIDSNAEVANALHKCIVAVLDHGADPNAVDSEGISILELAVHHIPIAWSKSCLRRERGSRRGSYQPLVNQHAMPAGF